MKEEYKRVYENRLILMSWVLDSSPESFKTYGEWLRNLQNKVRHEGNFSEDCCADCNGQRMIDLFLLHFRKSPNIIDAMLNYSEVEKPSILDLSSICDLIDRGELGVSKDIVKIKLMKNETNTATTTKKRKTSSTSTGTDLKRKKISTDYNLEKEMFIRQAEETGRTPKFLKDRRNVGKPAEYPIYYPDYPDVPRYWRVDDHFAFEELYAQFPKLEEKLQGAKQIQSLIQNGGLIPLRSIYSRCTEKDKPTGWSRDETRRFIKLANKYKASDYEFCTERVKEIYTELKTHRTYDSVLSYLKCYEKHLESIRNPIILPTYEETSDSISHFESTDGKIRKNLKIEDKETTGAEDNLAELSARTGRSISFLNERKRVGKPAEKPIYYPDHPNVPRYWSVDDMYAFDQVLALVPETENYYQRARKIRDMIENGQSIPFSSLIPRLKINNSSRSWTPEERKKFKDLAETYPASEFITSKERGIAIHKALNTRKTLNAILRRLQWYDICLESIKNPLILQNFDGSMDKDTKNINQQIKYEQSQSKVKAENQNPTYQSRTNSPENRLVQGPPSNEGPAYAEANRLSKVPAETSQFVGKLFEYVEEDKIITIC